MMRRPMLEDEDDECAACGALAEGNYSIEEHGFADGEEVELCDACGSGELPTMEELRGQIALRRVLRKAGLL